MRFAPIYKLLKGLISSRCGISNTLPHSETAQLVHETILFKGGPIVGGPIVGGPLGPTTILEYTLNDFDTISRSEI